MDFFVGSELYWTGMISAQRLLQLAAIALVVPGCESKPTGASSAASSASSPAPAGSDADQLPAIEVKPASPPKYSLAKLTEMELAAMTSKSGWTTIVVGKTPGQGSESAIRVSAFKKDAEGNLECAVSVRCGAAAGSPPPEHPPGVAYYTEATCEMKVEVRRGIRMKSVESRRLLEKLLASQPG